MLERHRFVFNCLTKMHLHRRDKVSLIPEDDVIALFPYYVAKSTKAESSHRVIKAPVRESFGCPIKILPPGIVPPQDIEFRSPEGGEIPRYTACEEEVIHRIRPA